LFLITLYLQQVLGDSALEAGLSYLPPALPIIVATGAAALMTRVGFKPVLIANLTGRRSLKQTLVLESARSC
jgi:predicted benzoate:H+ symporter BenE